MLIYRTCGGIHLMWMLCYISSCRSVEPWHRIYPAFMLYEASFLPLFLFSFWSTNEKLSKLDALSCVNRSCSSTISDDLLTEVRTYTLPWPTMETCQSLTVIPWPQSSDSIAQWSLSLHVQPNPILNCRPFPPSKSGHCAIMSSYCYCDLGVVDS